jgi:RHS repeat-associated protein
VSNKSGTSNQIISLPQGGGALHGIGETFSPDLQSGTGNFTVPIALPPGRNGLQPELSIVYSTGNGNGPFGLGWGLSVPGVMRKTAKGLPQYRDNSPSPEDWDTFVLSGAEDLVPIERSPGVTRYRPRTEGLFARIEHHYGEGNDYWQVWSKDGLVSIYGTAKPEDAPENWRDPTAISNPEDATKIYSWNLSQTVDPFGNRIIYEYEQDLVNDDERQWHQLYLKQIQYADYGEPNNPQFLAKVRFSYEDRPDPFSEYRAGFEIRTLRRCTHIEILTQPGQEVLTRRYHFIYLDQRTDLENLEALLPRNGMSLLSQVKVVGHDEANPITEKRQEELPPIEFGYSTFQPEGRNFFPIEGRDLPARSLGNPDIELADLFGNGLPDILEMNGTVRYWRNLGNGQFALPQEMKTAPAGLQLGDPGVQLVDADGDGRIDLMVHREGLTGYFPLQYDGRWDRKSFQRYDIAPSFAFDQPNVQLMDLNGDGITDVVRSGSRLECFENHPEKGWHKRYVGRIADEASFNFADPRIRWGDMSGDGLQDIVRIHDGNLEYWPNLGYGRWGKRVQMRNSPRFRYGYDPRRILIGDVDGDGVDDLIYVDDKKIILWINQSGNGWSEPIEIKGTPSVTDVDAVRLVDVLGTGLGGILWSSDANSRTRNNLYFLDLTGGLKPYLLHEMDNHMGAVTRVRYTPSTKFYLEDQKRPETRWQTPLPMPVLVVDRVEVIDQISGGKLTTEYRYHHGYWDGAEREFRGFGRVEQTDTEVFEDYDQTGLHGEGFAFAPVDRNKYFSPPMLTKTWFHQGPVGDEFGEWQELDYSHEYWDEDPQVLERPPDMVAFIRGLEKRRVKRDAYRTLRGRVLRTELYALDGSDRQSRPYTVTEASYGIREESPPSAENPKRSHIFFSFPLAQRTTQWERGEEPMTQFSFTTEYDEYGQPLAQSSLAVPRDRNSRVGADVGSDAFLSLQPELPTLTEMAGLLIDGRVLRKTVGTGWDNSGAVSQNALAAGEDGWVQASCSTVGKRALFGLSATSPDNHYNTIDYAVYFTNEPSILIYERGNYKAGISSLSETDVVRVERRGSQIDYLLNSEVIYTSAVPSETPLSVDLSLYDRESEIVNLCFSKDFFQRVEFEPYLATHSTTVYAKQPDLPALRDMTGLAIEGRILRKTAVKGWDNSGAVSDHALDVGEDGWVEASCSTVGKRAFFGLSAASPDDHYTSIDYAVYFTNTPSIIIYERGDSKKSIPGLTSSDVVRIQRRGSQIEYLLNGEVIYSSAVPSETPLSVDLAFYDREAEIKNLRFSKDLKTGYIRDRVVQTTSYEILNDGTQSVFELQESIQNGSAPRQLIGQANTYYDGAAFEGLPFGQIGDYGVPVRSEALALTEANLLEAYGQGQSPPYLVPDAAPNWTADYPQGFRDSLPPLAGYTFYSGDENHIRGYWVTASRQQYDFHDSTNAAPRGLLQVTRDPLGRDTTIEYDGYDLLPLQVTNPIGLTTTAVYDYRVMQPWQVTDANGNRSTVTFTALGLPASTAVMGKAGEAVGDIPAVPSSWLKYDFFAFERAGQPVWVHTLQREEHYWDVIREENQARAQRGDSPLTEGDIQSMFPADLEDELDQFPERFLQSVEYSDGFGRLVQSRAQSEDVRFGRFSFGTGVLPLDQTDTAGTRAEVRGRRRGETDPVNVVVSGWQIYDNKGQVVEQYEPFYSQGWDYQPPGAEEMGQNVEMYYDPRGQVILTLNPDGSRQRVIYGIPQDLGNPTDYRPTPWEAYTYDANDLATLSSKPVGEALELLTDRAPASHHFTPASIAIDALGRTITAIERNGPNPETDWYITRSTYDIRGNLLTLTDALGRVAFTYTYDIANQPRRTANIDAGVQQTVVDAVGKPLEQRDSKGALILQSYDVLDRPSRMWARDGVGQALTLRAQMEYGDGGSPEQPGADRAAARELNQLGQPVRHYDESGLVVFDEYDFKGNLLSKDQRVIADAVILQVFEQGTANNWQVQPFRVDWAQGDSLLEEQEYVTSMTYDALNRVTRMQYPEDVTGRRQELRPIYNRAGGLEQVELEGKTYVERIAYNAKGQRTLIAYGNGVMTRYAYDAETFQLKRLYTSDYTQLDDLTYQPTGAPLQDFAYTYDLVGNITQIQDRAAGSGVRTGHLGDNALNRRFTYDPLYRLLSATGRECQNIPKPRPWADEQRCGAGFFNRQGTPVWDNAPELTTLYRETYAYDPAGNMTRLQHQQEVQRNGGLEWETAWSRNFGMDGHTPEEWGQTWPQHLNGEWLNPPGNKLTHVEDRRAGVPSPETVAQTHFFDVNGNLIRENGSRHFEWDHSDQMKAFRTQTEGAEPTVYAHYLYDASGQRVKKLVRKGANQIEVTVYVDGVFEHHRQVQGSTTRENNSLQVMDDQSRIALVRVGAAFPDDSTPAVKYHLGDHLGSSHVVISADGRLMNREEMTPYGETSFGSFGRKRYRFTGKERDEESGLNYHGARYYAPWLVEWVSCDPAGTVDGLNLYRFVRNGPTVMVDSDGKQAAHKLPTNPVSPKSPGIPPNTTVPNAPPVNGNAPTPKSPGIPPNTAVPNTPPVNGNAPTPKSPGTPPNTAVPNTPPANQNFPARPAPTTGTSTSGFVLAALEAAAGAIQAVGPGISMGGVAGVYFWRTLNTRGPSGNSWGVRNPGLNYTMPPPSSGPNSGETSPESDSDSVPTSDAQSAPKRKKKNRRKNIQLHHIAPHANGISPKFESIFAKATLPGEKPITLHHPMNLVPVPGHQGGHGRKYSEIILSRLTTATKGIKPHTKAYQKALFGELSQLRIDVNDPKNQLYKMVRNPQWGTADEVNKMEPIEKDTRLLEILHPNYWGNLYSSGALCNLQCF